MANSLTYYGQSVALSRDFRGITGFTGGTEANVGGLTHLGTKLKLYNGVTSVPAKAGPSSAFVEVTGGGYAAKTIASGDYTLELVSGNYQIRIADQTWTAAGGSIANIGGSFLTDANDNVLGWWERSSVVTLADGDAITADDLNIRLT